MIFEKNPFTTAVSIPKSFHLTPFSPTFGIHHPTLMRQPIRMGGLGIRSKVEISPAAYVGGVEMPLPHSTNGNKVCK